MNSLLYLASSNDEKPRERGSGSLNQPRRSNSIRESNESLGSTSNRTQNITQSTTGNLPNANTSIFWRWLVYCISFFNSHAHQEQLQPKRKSRRHRKSQASASLPPIPRLFASQQRKLLVLDLDETLVHSMRRGFYRGSQLVEVHRNTTALSSCYYVAKRPYCIDFLNAVLQWYDVAIFTASVSEYADPIIDLLEHDLGRPIFKRRLYRDSCISDNNGGYIKDLNILGEDLSRVLLVDNSPISFAYQRSNGLTVEGWISDPTDRVLLQLLPLLFALRHTADVRSVLALHDSKLLPMVN